MRRVASLLGLGLLGMSACGGAARTAVSVTVPDITGASTLASCARFMAALPSSLTTGVVKLATTPSSPYVAAWGSLRSPIVARCGVGQPTGYQLSSNLIAINIDDTGEVGWFERDSGKDAVFTSVRRPTKVELSIPKGKYQVDVILGSVTRVVASTTPAGADGSS